MPLLSRKIKLQLSRTRAHALIDVIAYTTRHFGTIDFPSRNFSESRRIILRIEADIPIDKFEFQRSSQRNRNSGNCQKITTA